MTLSTTIQTPSSHSQCQSNGLSATAPLTVLHVLLDSQARFPLFENLVTGMDPAQFKHVICYLTGKGEPQRHPLANSVATIIELDMPKRKLKRYQLASIRKIANLIKKHHVDIVHCQRHKPTVYGTLAAWLSGHPAKVVTTVHGRNRTRTWSRKLLNRFLLKRVRRIFAVSDAVRQDILQTNHALPDTKVATVYNGIFTGPYRDLDLTQQEARTRIGLPDGFIFGTVGRLARVKAQSQLLQAFAALRKNHANVYLVLAGSGPLESDLHQLASALGLNNHVFFLGQRPDIPQVLCALDAFVLPSLSEGLPLSLLEAMAAELPVIATRVGGIPEILSHGSDGVMVTPSSIPELTDAMAQLVQIDQDQRKAMGRRLRERVQSAFTVQDMIAATTEHYLAVVNEPSS